MKKNILFPNDFTIDSLNNIKTILLKDQSEGKFNIILLHGLRSNDSISDLLFHSQHKTIQALKTTEFTDACDVLKNKFASRINTIRFDLFSGHNQSSFKRYLEGNNIAEAYIPFNYKLHLPHKNSFDIIPFIKKSHISVKELERNQPADAPEKGRLAEIFLNDVMVTARTS